MKNMTGEYFQPYEDDDHHSGDAGEETSEDVVPVFLPHNPHTLQSIPLKPLFNHTTIVAIDVSNIKLGETETGTLCAVRGAIIWKEKSRYKYLRLGPFPFHVTEENKREIYHLLRQYYFDTSKEANTPSLVHMQARISSLLERWIQTIICSSSQNAIILWDGSLTAGTIDSPANMVSQLLETARTRHNTVLAFSKMTRLRLRGHRLTDLVGKSPPPCLLEIEGFHVLSGPVRFLGNIYVAKLTEGSCSFRLDIDRKVPRERGLEAIQRLLGNDLILQSYPETLRLAHIYSTFTANEVIGIQRFIAQQCGLKIVTRPNIRRILFGPFGKGPEG